jgi:hypothetical protein
MKVLLICLMAVCSCEISIRGQDASPSSAQSPDASEIPKGYEVGERSVSPDGRFAILYPVRDEDNAAATLEMNVLVRLKPYAALAEIGDEPRWQGMRGSPAAKWNGNSIVAIWAAQKWGIGDLAVYEIENDKIKRVEKAWPEVEKYFDRDFKERFLKKYPKESDSYTFVSDRGDEEVISFKGRKLVLNIFADNKPNLAAGPHWTATLKGTWDIDKAKFEKVDFQPGEITIRPQEQ